MKKHLIKSVLALFTSIILFQTAHAEEEYRPGYLQAVINVNENIPIEKSTIFDASKSFIPDPSRKMSYSWDFGDGNRNEGVEVLHSYKQPGRYTISLTISDGAETQQAFLEIFAYRKMILLITDQTEVEDRIEIIKDFAEKKGVFINVVDSFGSSTEFISEEVLAKKLNEGSSELKNAKELVIWTQENAGLNAISRYLQNSDKKNLASFKDKTIVNLQELNSSTINRIQRQFEIIKPKNIVLAKEAAIYALIDSNNQEEFINILEKGGYEYEIVDSKSGKIRPWNFMTYFVNLLINKGIPDNTIALLLLLPVIVTIVAFMKQVVGVTTFGIYTPSIITLSFLIIGMHAGLLTLISAVIIGILVMPILKRIRMLYFPKMAILIIMFSLTLLLILIASTYMRLFDAQFLSIAIFPMLILSTLVEKFISVKTEKGLNSAAALMAATILVAIIAYFFVGGEINLGFVKFKFDFIKGIIMSYPEIIFLLIIVNLLLGKWTGLRLLERMRFREVLRHIEE